MNKLCFNCKLFLSVTLIFLLGNGLTNAQALPHFEWAKQMAGDKADSGMAVTVSKDGTNVYYSGSFSHNATFGSTTLIGAGGTDIFITKMDVSGNYEWSQRMGGSGNDQSTSVAVDKDGNVYATGYFSGTATFGTTSLVSAGGTDIFLVKLDPTGKILWAQGIGGTGDDRGNAIAVKDDGTIYFTGYFSKNVSFDHGKKTLYSQGGIDFLVAKYSTDGEYVWVSNAGAYGQDEGKGIAIDEKGNVAVTGIFGSSLFFAHKYLVSNGGIDAFVYKSDEAGNALWACLLGSTTDDYGTSVAFDADGNILATGYFTQTTDFDPGSGETKLTPPCPSCALNDAHPADIYVVKLDGDGKFGWAAQMGGNSEDRSYSIATDAEGSVYTTGYYQSNPADFNPGSDAEELTPETPTFVSKLNKSGKFEWVRSWGDRTPGPLMGKQTILCIGNAIAVDKNLNVYTTGRFAEITNKKINLYPQPSPDDDSLMFASKGNMDIFVHKMSQTVCQPTTYKLEKKECGSFEFNHKVYDKSGTYYDTLINAGGCDSFVTLILTINQSTSSNIKDTACNSYNFLGKTYTQSGTYKDTISNAAGCDSVITLKLTVNKSTTGTIEDRVCESYSFNGKTYTKSGTYKDTIPNAAGCDSIITLNLQIYHIDPDTLHETTCDDYTFGDSVYTASGVYPHTFVSEKKCDSIIVLDLTVNKIDVSVTQNGNELSAVPGAAYQWLDCNKDHAPILNATQQSYTSDVEGDFAVIVTKGDCSDTSGCYHVEGVGIQETGLAKNVMLYPNPGHEMITLKAGSPLKNADLKIINIVGQTLLEKSGFSGSRLSLDIRHYATGVYYLEIKEGYKMARIKFIKD